MQIKNISNVLLLTTSITFILTLSKNVHSAGWEIVEKHSNIYAKLSDQNNGRGNEAVFRCVGQNKLAVAFEVMPPYSRTEYWNYSLEFSDNETFDGNYTLSPSTTFVEISSSKLFNALKNNYSFTFSKWKDGSDRKWRTSYYYSPNDIFYSWREIIKKCDFK